MTFYTRKDWGARPAGPWPGSRGKTDIGTVHWSGTKITEGGTLPGSLEAQPKKPGRKWYRLWRDPNTPAAQRRKLSKMIRRYNTALREWKHSQEQEMPAYVLEAEKAVMRQFQNYHMDGHGWSDIGYHRVIFASGNVYEGRNFAATGAHAINANHTTGYCFVMGPGDEPTPAMIRTFHEMRHVDGVTRYKGHNQWPGNATACPGPRLTEVLKLPVNL